MKLQKSIKSVTAALFLAAVLQGCAGTGESSAPAPSPTPTPLEIYSQGLDCSKQENADGELLGFCFTLTAEGTEQEDWVAGDIRGPWATFEFLCQTTGPSSVSISGGPLLTTHFTNPEADFQWDPKAYPLIEVSIDQKPKEEITYGVRNMYGKPQPDSIFLNNNPNFMRELAGAETLQVWARDADGVPHEFAFDVKDNVSQVAKLSAWGMDCKF